MTMHRGFTLIELLMVISIIAILAGLILGVVGVVRRQAWDMDTKRRLGAVEEALQQYQSGDNQAYLMQRWGLGHDFRWSPIRTVFESLRDEFGYTLSTAATPTVAAGSRRRPSNVALDFSGSPTDFSLDHRVRWGVRSGTNTFSWVSWSTIGETLDRTFEVMPTRQWPVILESEYNAQWPMLRETVSGGVYTQTCWPASDWNLPTPGVVRPIWEWAWGERIFVRQTASQVEQIQDRKLSDLSPLSTIDLMIMAGILPNDGTGPSAFRTDRGTRRPWNDRWGTPLVIAHASFIAPRYGFQDNGATPWAETTDLLLGPRDIFMRRAKDTYGYNRAIYLCVGAAGLKRRTELPMPWDSIATDRTTLRNLWLQIIDTCSASDWGANGFRSPPWVGVRVGTRNDERCYLSTPMVIK